MNLTIKQATRQGEIKLCAVPECGQDRYCKGYCKLHYSRFKRHGSPDKPAPYDRRGDKNPRWNGGQTRDGGGRCYLYRPGHPHANKWGYVYRYRIVVEEHIGRHLKPNELVHHKNGDCSDDRIDNLELMTPSTHAFQHNLLRKRNEHGQFTSQKSN